MTVTVTGLKGQLLDGDETDELLDTTVFALDDIELEVKLNGPKVEKTVLDERWLVVQVVLVLLRMVGATLLEVAMEEVVTVAGY